MSLLIFFSGAGGGGGPTEEFGAVSFAGAGSFTALSRVFAATSLAGAGSFTAKAGLPVYALASFTGSSNALFVSRFTGTDYHLYVVDIDGNRFGEVENAKITNVTFELNGVGGLDFTIPTTDPDATLIQPGREVQLWRGDQLLFWGPIVRPQVRLWEATYQCAGSFWYFTRRFMGRADRVNVLVNGDFENSETGWSFAGGVTHAPDVTRKVEGTKSLRLSGATADHVQYATQTWEHGGVTIPPWPGDFMTVSAWVYIPSADYHGGAFEDRGLMALHWVDGKVVYVQAATIDDDTVKDQWIPLEVGVPVVKAGESVEVRLYPPHGVAYYDLVTMTFMESLSFGNVITGEGVDLTIVIEGIVDYAQGHAPYDWGHGKTDLNIDYAGDPTGHTILIAYQLAEHRNIAEAILEYVRDGLLDVDIALTPTKRVFTTYAPRKGHYRPDLTLELDGNVADFSWSWDGQAAASSVVVLGPGDGPDRPEGGASDPSFLGGLDLEWVESAPDNVTVGQLDDRAAERLAVGTHPEVIEMKTLPNAGIIGQLQLGDTVPVVIDHGPLAVNTAYRVVQIALKPDLDQATITLNPVTS